MKTYIVGKLSSPACGRGRGPKRSLGEVRECLSVDSLIYPTASRRAPFFSRSSREKTLAMCDSPALVGWGGGSWYRDSLPNAPCHTAVATLSKAISVRSKLSNLLSGTMLGPPERAGIGQCANATHRNPEIHDLFSFKARTESAAPFKPLAMPAGRPLKLRRGVE